MSLQRLAIAAIAVGLGLTSAAHAAAPYAWSIAGSAPTDYEFAMDATTAASGVKSALITAKPGARSDGFGTLMQIIAADDYRGGRWRLSGYLRTDAAKRAQIWMRVDGPDRQILSFDNMDSRPVTGTTSWTQYDIVLDVPSASTDIAFGFLLIASGKVWGDSFKLEKVGATVPVTSAGPALPRAPANLDFEDSDSQSLLPAGAPISAHWTSRRIRFVYSPITDGFKTTYYTCTGLRDDMTAILRELGARNDLVVAPVGCPGGIYKGLDATFSVLEPAAIGGQIKGASQTVAARWDTITLHTDMSCELIKQVSRQILPLFAARKVGPANCLSESSVKLRNAPLSVEVLRPVDARSSPQSAP